MEVLSLISLTRQDSGSIPKLSLFPGGNPTHLHARAAAHEHAGRGIFSLSFHFKIVHEKGGKIHLSRKHQRVYILSNVFVSASKVPNI